MYAVRGPVYLPYEEEVEEGRTEYVPASATKAAYTKISLRLVGDNDCA